jgi:hypothetical protein
MVMVDAWKGTRFALKIYEYAIPPLAMQVIKLLAEIGFIVHEDFPRHNARRTPVTRLRAAPQKALVA